MPYTKAQYVTLLSDDSNESDALDRVTGRYEYIEELYPNLSADGIASLVNALSIERANQTNEVFTGLANALTASNATIVAAITALSGWGE